MVTKPLCSCEMVPLYKLSAVLQYEDVSLSLNREVSGESIDD